MKLNRVKDASDKKILVDMLFWAVDNPAPANYLLISGDRDFSNALHQLRMRRYNILLAQPNKASAALVAAAQCVWHWTSLVSGGFPFNTKNINPSQQHEKLTSARPIIPSTQPPDTTLALGGQKFPVPGRIADSNSQLSSGSQSLNQVNITRMKNLSIKVGESKSLQSSHQPETVPAKRFMKAPHEFFIAPSNTVRPSRSYPNLFPGNLDTSYKNAKNLAENLHNQLKQSRPPYVPDKMISVNSNNTLLSVSSISDESRVSAASSVAASPDGGKLSMSNYSKKDPVLSNPSGEDSRSKSTVSLNLSNSYVDDNGTVKSSTNQSCDNVDGKYLHSKLPFSSPSNGAPNNGVRGRQGCHPPPEGLIGVILLALNILKVEKIAPSEANITDCIRYGDPKFCNTDVRKALECALEQQMIVKQRLGKMELYVGRIERLWTCENPVGGNVEQYPEATWGAIHKFITSLVGHSAIIASECRYEAALILKRSCLKAFPLGEVFRILNLIITMKKWINHAHLGWQPISITVSETKHDSGT
ncbi:hypothetical protein BUALT_Bualt02G0247900 [Buddleja alternifolia]|uniref:NYN domain-containing protein n=1 Tax=Buddleja alternifolia TaxID=168488 RepID=A0AAV6Y4A3_9LAMI|nr:hypothetical protein BUALT_Bualt02G0247900 [Buddleja alternifolia]